MDKSLLPPLGRTATWQKITDAAKSGMFVLQVCKNCAEVQYPPRELCGTCLHDELEWEEVSSEGSLISHTELNASTNAFYRQHLPLKVALVKLDCGPTVFAFLADGQAATKDRVRLLIRPDKGGAGVLVAITDTTGEREQIVSLDAILSIET